MQEVIPELLGNADAVRLLELCLNRAKQGKMTYVGILMCEEPNFINLETAGSSNMEDKLPEVLDRFKSAIVPRVCNRNDAPPRDPKLGLDYVCYNVAGMPISYDFMCWLINREMQRRQANAPAPLKVGFWFGWDGKSGLETEYRKNMFSHVVHPLLRCIGAVEDPVAVGGIYDHKDLFAPMLDLVRACRGIAKFPRLKPSEKVEHAMRKTLDGKRPVTITLRESDHWRFRNSNKPAWIAFANDLKKKGKQVIFLRDTARAEEEIEGHDIFPQASYDLEIRLALYEQAEANLFISNGPCGLAWAGSRPYLIFQPMDEDCAHAASTSRWWAEYADMKPGDQYPWALRGQRLVWELDTYQNISRAWEELQGELHGSHLAA